MKKVQLCRHCLSPDHTSILCWSQPRKPIARSTKPIARNKPLKKVGKQTQKWISERKYWMEKHPPDKDGFWYCHYCGRRLVASKKNWAYLDGSAMILTVDHIWPRGSNKKLRYTDANLVPACGPDNRLKGSLDYAKFVEKYYPHLMVNIPAVYNIKHNLLMKGENKQGNTQLQTSAGFETFN